MRVTGVGRWLDEALDKVYVSANNVDEQLAYIREWISHGTCCKDRRGRVNQLWHWAKRVKSGDTERAAEYLEDLISTTSE